MFIIQCQTCVYTHTRPHDKGCKLDSAGKEGGALCVVGVYLGVSLLPSLLCLGSKGVTQGSMYK